MNRFTRSFLLSLIGVVVLLFSSCNKDDEFDYAKQLEIEKALIDEYITDHDLTVLTDTLGYGLKYVLLEEGDGPKPTLSNYILVSYSGTVMSTGVEFDSSDSSYFSLYYLITGWQVLLPHLKEGSKVRMFIPSQYAYGPSGYGEIPGKEPLIFDIELKKVLNQFELEQLFIDQYLDSEDIVPLIDDVTGLRYVISAEGTGQSPNISSKVNVDYVGKFLSNEAQFDKKSGLDVELSNVITGWQVLLPKIKEGGKITMYLPSKYAYGSSGYNSIPGNTPLIFEVTLNSVLD